MHQKWKLAYVGFQNFYNISWIFIGKISIFRWKILYTRPKIFRYFYTGVEAPTNILAACRDEEQGAKWSFSVFLA